MTDNEIIKALEDYENSNIVQMNNGEILSIGDILDLINRQKAELNQYAEEKHELMIEKDKLFDIAEKQKAEIERLKKGINIELENYATEYDNKIKVEAVKEFAERLKETPLRFRVEHTTHFDKPPITKMVLFIDDTDIDNLLKETVGDADGKRKEEIP